MRQLSILLFVLAACGDDPAADVLGVGAQCAGEEDCLAEQMCLAFKGGYCGITACARDADCPEASACIAHDDGINYCFRVCVDKPDCNANRDVENEANCVGNAVFVDGANGRKACVPPSGS